MVNLNDIAELLQERADRFDSLDVFADDVDELASKRAELFQLIETRPRPRFLAAAGRRRLLVEFHDHGVARFRLTTKKTSARKAPIAAGILGAALGAATKEKNGFLGGLILGLLVGRLLDTPDRAMALRFDELTQEWRLYDGPLLDWAKKRLAAA